MSDVDLLQMVNEAIEEEDELEEDIEVEAEVVEVVEETSLAVIEQSIADDRLQRKLFESLRLPTRQRKLTLPVNQAKQLKLHVNALRTGSHAAVPLICGGGEKCPFSGFCPLTIWDEATTPPTQDPNSPWPVLDQCPVEGLVIEAKMRDYMEEYEVKDQDVTDLAIISKIVELDIYDQRLSMNLAQEENQSLIVEDVSHVSPKTNSVYYQTKIHPALEAKLAIDRRKAELLRAMVGTRREKIKTAGDKGALTDAVKIMTQLRARIEGAYDDDDTIDVEVIEEEQVNE